MSACDIALAQKSGISLLNLIWQSFTESYRQNPIYSHTGQ